MFQKQTQQHSRARILSPLQLNQTTSILQNPRLDIGVFRDLDQHIFSKGVDYKPSLNSFCACKCGKCLLNILASIHILNILNFHNKESFLTLIILVNNPLFSVVSAACLTSSVLIIRVVAIDPNTSDKTKSLLLEDRKAP